MAFGLNGCATNYATLHKNAFVADTHNDVLLRVVAGEDITVRTDTGHTDIPRMQEGGLDLEAFVVWVNPRQYLPDSASIQADIIIDSMETLVKKSNGKLAPVRSMDELTRNEKSETISAMLVMEGGHPLENDLQKLEHFYERGVRYLGLTWNNSTDWATSAHDETKNDSLTFTGLTDFGRDVVRKCNDLGLIVDVSHAGEKTFWDVMETTSKPVIASHSCVYALCPHYRNLKGDQLQAIRDNGGVVFVNFYPGYLDSTYKKKADRILEQFKPRLDSLKSLYSEHSDEFREARRKLIGEKFREIAPPVDVIIDHIEYIAKLIGTDHVGLGSDFDGVEILPRGMEDVSKLPVITKKLIERGYSEQDIRKILGENFKRVFAAVVG